MIYTGLDLKKTKKDSRDFSHRKTFGSFPIHNLPDNYLLESTILNQGQTYHCTAYSACAVQEVQEGVSFDPEWFYKQEGIVDGNPTEYGYGMRIPMKTGIEKGFKPVGGDDKDAETYKEGGYFAVDGDYDTFDNIRIAMWLARNEKKCPMIGVMWHEEWLTNKGIVSEKKPEKEVGGHAIKCAGWKKIDGKEYLVIQNSYGTEYGDNGMFYFPRTIVNKYFVWKFMWRSVFEQSQIKTIGTIIPLLRKVVGLLSELVKITIGTFR